MHRKEQRGVNELGDWNKVLEWVERSCKQMR